MNSFLSSVVNDLVRGDMVERIMSLTMIILFVVVVALIGFFIYHLIDTVGTEEKIVTASVVDRDYTPAWVQTTMVLSGKVMVPMVTPHAERWSIKVYTEDNDYLWCDTTKDMYDDPDLYTTIVKVAVSSGRLSDNSFAKRVFY